ncbi:MAG: bestrophin family ion channel [Cyclobacteriaceae bacterium]
MYTRKKYKIWDMIKWTSREIRFFLIIAFVVTILYQVLGFGWMKIPWTPIALLGTAVAFLIGFQSNAAYGRIWEARQIWGGIVNDSRMLAIMVKDMITNEYADVKVSDDELKEHQRSIIYRHIAWLTALRYAMRQPRQWEITHNTKRPNEWKDRLFVPEFENKLEDELSVLLSEEEKTYTLSKTNKAATLLSLQSKSIRALKERGLIWEFSFLEIEGKLNELMTHQGKSERIKNFPYPRQFATLGYDCVNLFILLLPFGVIPEFSDIGLELSEQYPWTKDYFVWLGIPFSALVSWIFNTMQRIGSVGENPFEGAPNDVPISTMSRGIEIDLREMLDEPKDKIPDPMEVIYDVQM